MAQISEIMLGTKYVDRKNSKRIGEVIEVNEKTKTVTLQFEDGKSRPFVVTTLSKSFKKMDEAETATEEAPVKDAGDVADQPEAKEPEKTSNEELDKLNESAKKTSEIINKAEAKEDAEKKPKKAEKKPKSEKKPKKEDKQVIDIAIKTMDALKVTHRESWQNKGTAYYVGKVRVFECWKRMERVRINYNPDFTSLDAKLCIEKIEDKRSNSHLSVTCYVQADKIADAITALIKKTDSKAVEAENAKKAEKKSKPKKEKAEKTEFEEPAKAEKKTTK